MECNGICHNDKADYFKITCPGPYNNVPLKLKVSKDGSSHIKYKDICEQPQQYARIAYSNPPYYFEVDSNGQMADYQIRPVTRIHSRIPHHFEILSSFFQYYQITPTWIDCKGNKGWFDEETGNWTGALGKVDKYVCV